MKHILMILGMCISLNINAYDFELNGIYYDINSDNNSVTVTYEKINLGMTFSPYSGEISIPKRVVYEGSSYRVKFINSSAFRGCSGLTSITIPNSVTYIGHSAFGGCSGLTSITIPNSVIYIGMHAFYDCSGLISITIPNSVTSIGNSAFVGCSGLTSILVEDGNTVYDSRDNCNAIIETSSNTLVSGCSTTIFLIASPL